MSFKPILFNTEMVQAIQVGRKTQTRRIVKNQDGIHPRRSNIGFLGWDDGHGYRMNPPCKAGDILWVRETWADVPETKPGNIHYKASATIEDLKWFNEQGWKWRPSIHMPKEAARIFLRVKDVRVERLQDITEEQAEKEGCSAGRFHVTCGPFGNYNEPPEEFDAVEDFRRVWDSTIKPDDLDKYGWDANPWVWVIEFERCDQPEGWPAL